MPRQQFCAHKKTRLASQFFAAAVRKGFAFLALNQTYFRLLNCIRLNAYRMAVITEDMPKDTYALSSCHQKQVISIS